MRTIIKLKKEYPTSKLSKTLTITMTLLGAALLPASAASPATTVKLLSLANGGVTDYVIERPDISNAVPARLRGKTFYKIYAFQNPPLWKAQIATIKHFDINGGNNQYD